MFVDSKTKFNSYSNSFVNVNVRVSVRSASVSFSDSISKEEWVVEWNCIFKPLIVLCTLFKSNILDK